MSKGSTGAAAGGGALYGLGIFGALFYYWLHEEGRRLPEAARRGGNYRAVIARR